MSDALKAAVLGLIQGLTEFFPVSSTAHLMALRRILAFEVEGLAFDVAVHLATLLAVLIYFRREILTVAMGPQRTRVFLLLVLGTLPAVAAGVLLKDHRDHFSPWVVVGGWLFSGAYLLLSRGRDGQGRYASMPIATGMAIGTAQALAIFPGVSRSGSTITAGVWLGLAREEAARFSFLLAIPAILGAGALKTLDLIESPARYADVAAAAAVAMPIAFTAGIFSIHYLLKIVRRDVFHRFGWYNLAAAAGFAAYLVLA
jgi:undecaprenyl-diphosphatase